MNATYGEQQEEMAICIHSYLWTSRRHLVDLVRNMFTNSCGIKAEFWFCETLSLRLMTHHTQECKICIYHETHCYGVYQ